MKVPCIRKTAAVSSCTGRTPDALQTSAFFGYFLRFSTSYTPFVTQHENCKSAGLFAGRRRKSRV